MIFRDFAFWPGIAICLALTLALVTSWEAAPLLANGSESPSPSVEWKTPSVSTPSIIEQLAEVEPRSPLPEGLIARRVRTDESCQSYLKQLSDGGRKVWRRLEELAERLGRMPSLPEWTELLVETDAVITGKDRGCLFFCFGSIQKVELSAQELARMYRKKRAKIESISVDYDVRYVIASPPKGSVEVPPTRSSCTFIAEGDRLLYRRAEFKGEESLEEETETFDGEIVRTLLRSPGGSLYASLMELDWRSRFFDQCNPLVCARLINSPVDFGRERDDVDLSAEVRSLFAYETPVEINGIECRAFGAYDRQYYCSPAHGYALVAVRHAAGYDTNLKHYVRDGNRHRELNSDFVAAIDDLWLPGRSETWWIRDGRVTRLIRMRVDEYQINDPVEGAVFDDIIPDGTFVSDALRDETYVMGEREIGRSN